jgi:hypothetical protein
MSQEENSAGKDMGYVLKQMYFSANDKNAIIALKYFDLRTSAG